MSERLLEIARAREAAEWNRPGTDKTWVLQVTWEHRRFLEELRVAERVERE